jgi:tetratricopeptide (TPR) repeat protein
MVVRTASLDGEDGLLPDEIRAELDRVLASDIFRAAPQLTAFLSYVVEQTLAGRAGELKGYTIAVEAFGRPPDFDPQADPIVRVEAGRLRKALNLYFAAEGVADPIRITIPVGAYVPAFERVVPLEPPEAETAGPIALPAQGEDLEAAGSGAAAAGPSRYWLYAAGFGLAFGLAAVGSWYWSGGDARQMAPRLPDLASQLPPPPAAPYSAPAPAVRAVPPVRARLPVVSVEVAETVTDASLDDVTRSFVRHLADTLARFDDMVVVKLPQPLTRSGEGADYILSVSIAQAGSVIEGTARLSTAKGGRVVWSTSGERSVDQFADGARRRETAQQLAIRLAQPFGVLHADARLAPPTPEAWCLYLAVNLRRTMKAEDHLAARTCLEGVVARDPEFHPAWSQLALLTLDEYSSDFNARPGSALDRALAAAVTAVRLAPASARAHQVMMDTLFLRGAVDDALKSGREALTRNPYDPDVLAALGAHYVQLNRPAEGLPLLEQAVALSSGRPPWYDFFLYLAAYLTGATRLAEAHAALINAEETPFGLIGRAMAAAASGDKFALEHALQTLRRKVPLFDLDARLYLARRGFSAEVAERIIAAIAPGTVPPR